MNNDQAFVQAVEEYLSLRRQHAELVKQIEAAGKHLNAIWRKQPMPDDVLQTREQLDAAEEHLEALRERIPTIKARMSELTGALLLNAQDKAARRERDALKQELDSLPLEIGAAEAQRVLAHVQAFAVEYAYAKRWHQQLRGFAREQQDVPQVERHSALGAITYELDHSRIRPVLARAKQLYGEGIDLQDEATWQAAALVKAEEAQHQAAAEIAGASQRMKDAYRIMQSTYVAVG